ncbi:ribonuclease H2 non-catalytic subunit-domain-containing protein [Apodospora peruviana]|uniref:Ribonuclease H2 non-catalytic subunit-domain-containing protein n=1 Tax=Apodospora peruviana TaxID=516989 RepID=A0AAE0I6H9_9PEZI|nr:ribonuclease H2 non-catalytic subunit-domain-containing protein [Apodospora peruviana]
MPNPILKLVEPEKSSDDKPATTTTTTPHMLPCRIHHDGPVEPVQSFWDPRVEEDGTKTAYFRGRKLIGKTVKLPEGYRGVVAAAAGTEIKDRRPEDDGNGVDDLEGEGQPELGKLQLQAEFDEMVIWGHEATVDVSADPYVRGMEEWLDLANQIHSYTTTPSTEK